MLKGLPDRSWCTRVALKANFHHLLLTLALFFSSPTFFPLLTHNVEVTFSSDSPKRKDSKDF